MEFLDLKFGILRGVPGHGQSYISIGSQPRSSFLISNIDCVSWSYLLAVCSLQSLAVSEFLDLLNSVSALVRLDTMTLYRSSELELNQLITLSGYRVPNNFYVDFRLNTP